MKPRWPKRTILPKPRASAIDVEAGAPRVSVVIPTYNRAALLPRAMRSVLAQTFRDLELIVVDDASADGSADLVERCNDPRARVVRLTKNGGVSRALNEGIAVARGEWVAFLGDDDEWLPELLGRLTARVDAGGGAFSLVYSNARVEPAAAAPERAPHLPEGDVLDDLLNGTMQLYTSACIVRRTVLLEFGGFDEAIRQGEDWDLWLRMASVSHRFAVVPEPLAVIHRRHGLSQLTDDRVLRALSFQRGGRRWGSLARKRLGVEYYRRRRRWRSRQIARSHRKLVKRLMRAGSRAEAWRYARRMAPALPWGASFVAQALLVTAFGRWPYRVRRAFKALGRRGNAAGDATASVEAKK